jgi:hypothetical protein
VPIPEGWTGATAVHTVVLEQVAVAVTLPNTADAEPAAKLPPVNVTVVPAAPDAGLMLTWSADV